MKKPAGRPPVPGEKRERLVQFYLTKVDADKLFKAVEAGAFKGVSTLLTALVEPIIQGGFSVESAARSVNRLQKHWESKGVKFTVTLRSLLQSGRDLFAPPPPIPDDVEDISQLIADLRALLAELENQTKPTLTNDNVDRNPAPARTLGVRGQEKNQDLAGAHKRTRQRPAGSEA